MFSGLNHFLQAMVDLMAWNPLFNIAWATLLGIIIGMLPGLTATLGLALLTTLTFKMPLASTSKVTSICGMPRGAGGIPSSVNLPSDLLSAAIGRSPCST